MGRRSSKQFGVPPSGGLLDLQFKNLSSSTQARVNAELQTTISPHSFRVSPNSIQNSSQLIQTRLHAVLFFKHPNRGEPNVILATPRPIQDYAQLILNSSQLIQISLQLIQDYPQLIRN